MLCNGGLVSRINKLKDREVMFLLLLLSFLVRQIWNLYIKNPWAMGDELGVMSVSAHMAGYDWREVFQSVTADGSVNFYGGGLGIVFTPLFLLIKNRPFLLYQSILCICSLFQSISVVISYSIMKRSFAIENKLFCALVSIAASFFVTSRSTNAMNENALILCTWITIYLVMELVQTKNIFHKRICSIVLPLILGYSYTIHTRAIILIASTIFILLFFDLLLKRKFVIYKIFIPSLIIFFVIAMKFNDFTLNQIFLSESGSFAYNTSSTATVSVLSGLKELIVTGQWRAFGDILLSNIWGLSFVTINLFLIIFFIWLKDLGRLIQMLIRKQKENIDDETCKYLLLGGIIYLCAFGMLFLYSIHGLGNAINAIETGTCTRSYFYLRYPGAFMGPIITMAGIKVWGNRGRVITKEVAVAISCAVCCLIYTCISIVPKIAEYGDKQFDFYHYFAPFYLGKYGQEVLSYHFYIATAVVIILTASLLVLLHFKKKILAAFLIMCVFIYQYSYMAYQFDRVQANEINRYTYAVSELFYENKDLAKKIDTLYWPLIEGSWEAPYVAQYYLPALTIEKRMPENESGFTIITSKYIGKDIIGTECSWTKLDEVTYIYAKGEDLTIFKDIGLEFERVK